LNLSVSDFPENIEKRVENMNVIIAGHINGAGFSSYMNVTGIQKRKATVSIRRIIFNIRKINRGLMSVIFRLPRKSH
jgi:hypothetical protein